MKYSDSFTEIVNQGVKEKFYIGTGNPNSKVLIVGKETAISDTNMLEKQNKKNYEQNAFDWIRNIENNICEITKNWIYEAYINDGYATNNPIFAFKGVKINEHGEGQTWRKYQKLCDVIFNGEMVTDKDRPYDFQKHFFITEMNDNPEKTTSKAQKEKDFKPKLKKRKDVFFKSDFIQNFPIIVLACSNYIWNFGEGDDRQIDNLFGVKYSHNYTTTTTKSEKYFYVHYNENKTKLVIHTNQLSGSNASNELLENLGLLIRDFIKQNKLYS